VRREPRQRPLQLEPGQHAAHGVGLGRHRGPEQGHDRVADVLLHHAAVLADHLAGGGEEAGLQVADQFGVGVLDVRGEPNEVDEQDADPAAVLGGHHQGPGGGVAVPRGAAGGTEGGVGGEAAAAPGAGRGQGSAAPAAEPVLSCGGASTTFAMGDDADLLDPSRVDMC
jgi:hypothetical protein